MIRIDHWHKTCYAVDYHAQHKNGNEKHDRALSGHNQKAFFIAHIFSGDNSVGQDPVRNYRAVADQNECYHRAGSCERSFNYKSTARRNTFYYRNYDEDNISRSPANTNTTYNFLKNYGITKKEFEIIELISNELGTDDICKELFISHSAFNKHISNIYKKTSVKNRVELLNLHKYELGKNE